MGDPLIIRYHVHIHPLLAKASVSGNVPARGPMSIEDLLDRIRTSSKRLKWATADSLSAYSKQKHRRLDVGETVLPGDSVLFTPRPEAPVFVLLPLWAWATIAMVAVAGYTAYAYIDMKNQLASMKQNDPMREDSAASQAYSFEIKENYKTDSTPIPVLYGQTRLGATVLNRVIWAPEKSKNEVARVLLGLCEGPITAIAPNGADDIFFDDTPLSAYSNASYQTFVGDADDADDVPEGFEELYQQHYPDTSLMDPLAFYQSINNPILDAANVWMNLDDKRPAPYQAMSGVSSGTSLWLRNTDASIFYDPDTRDKIIPYGEPFAYQFWLRVDASTWAGLSSDQYGLSFFANPISVQEDTVRCFSLLFVVNKSAGTVTFRFRQWYSSDVYAESMKYNISITSQKLPYAQIFNGQHQHVYFYRDGSTFRWYLGGQDISEPSTDVIGSKASSIDAYTEADGERFGFGRHKIRKDSGTLTVNLALPCYIRNFAFHVGKVPWREEFTPPGQFADLRELYSDGGQAEFHYRGKADKMMATYRFPNGIYDDSSETWQACFTEDIEFSEDGSALALWDEDDALEGPDFGSTDVYGRWLGVFSYTKWIPFDYVGITSEACFNSLVIGEQVKTSLVSDDAGTARIIGKREIAASPYYLVYLADITNPDEFVGAGSLHGITSEASCTIATGGLTTESVEADITFTTRNRLTTRGSGTDKVNQASLYSVTAVRRIPMAYPRLAKLAVEIEAQDRLARVPTVNVICQRSFVNIRFYTGVSYVTVPMTADNPAWVVYDILTNTQYGLGIDPANIDYASFSGWAGYCDNLVLDPPDFDTQSRRITVNGIFDQKNMNAYDAIDQIAQVGRARISVIGSVYYARVNKPSEPVMVISSAVYDEDSFSIEWVEDQGKPDVLILEFLHAEQGYKKDSVEAVAGELSSDPAFANEMNVETIFVPFITAKGQAQREADLRLATMRAISWRYEWSMDVEGLTLEPGDVVLLQSESNRLSFGGKIVSVDEILETVTIDREIMLASSIYSGTEDVRICVRVNVSDTLYQLTITGPWDVETDTFNVDGIGMDTMTMLGEIAAGDPIAVGRYGYELEPVRIEDISIDSDYKMNFVGYNYDESIYSETEIGGGSGS